PTASNAPTRTAGSGALCTFGTVTLFVGGGSRCAVSTAGVTGIGVSGIGDSSLRVSRAGTGASGSFGGRSILRAATGAGSYLCGNTATGTARLTGLNVSELLWRGGRSAAECAIAMAPSRHVTCRPTLKATPGTREYLVEVSGVG